MKRKICVVITARPSYARIKTALNAIKQHDGLELQLVVSGSALLDRYGSVVDVIQNDGFTPDATVYMLVEGENLVTSAKSTGVGIMELTSVFDRLQPDAVLSIADRYETIATAIASSYMNIPVVHVQGGEVTGSIDEKVRHAVTKLSDVHLVANTAAADRVIRMGENTEKVFVTGCPSVDIAAIAATKSNLSSDELQGVGGLVSLDSKYIIVMHHPVTYEWQDAESQTMLLLEAVKQLSMPTLWFWPNVDAGSDATSKAIRRFREISEADHIRFIKNLPPEDFLRLLHHAQCLIGNSSVGIRESGFLGVPVVNIGSRQKGRERAGNVMDVPYEMNSLLDALNAQLQHGRYDSEELYGDGAAGEKIANILASVPLTYEKRITY